MNTLLAEHKIKGYVVNIAQGRRGLENHHHDVSIMEVCERGVDARLPRTNMYRRREEVDEHKGDRAQVGFPRSFVDSTPM